jgi:hypothetical protein
VVYEVFCGRTVTYRGALAQLAAPEIASQILATPARIT